MGYFVPCVHVVLSGMGGELSRQTANLWSKTEDESFGIESSQEEIDQANQVRIKSALINLITDAIIQPGDTISIEEGETEI